MVSRESRTPEAGPGRVATFIDLALTAILTTVVLWVSLTSVPLTPPTPASVALGALFVLVLPGYAVTAALFPVQSHSRSSETASANRPSISPMERLVLTVGLSLAITPLTVLALNFTAFGIGQTSVLSGISIVVVVAVVVAWVRRAAVPAHRRFCLVPPRLLNGRAGSDSISVPKTNVLIAGFLVVSAGLAGATLTGQQSGEQYTEFYLLTSNGENGTLVAEEYPTRLGHDQPQSIHVGIENHERRAVEYTVVAELQRIRTTDGERRVVEESRLDQFSTALQAGETYRQQRELTTDSSMTGDQLRLIFLLYRGSPPETTTEANAYRSTHIWVNVTNS